MIQRRIKHTKSKRNLPFSSILLLIAILEVSVWSVGCVEDPVKDFLIRENSAFRTDLSKVSDILHSQFESSLLSLLHQQLTLLSQEKQYFFQEQSNLESRASIFSTLTRFSTSIVSLLSLFYFLLTSAGFSSPEKADSTSLPKNGQYGLFS